MTTFNMTLASVTYDDASGSVTFIFKAMDPLVLPDAALQSPDPVSVVVTPQTYTSTIKLPRNQGDPPTVTYQNADGVFVRQTWNGTAWSAPVIPPQEPTVSRPVKP